MKKSILLSGVVISIIMTGCSTTQPKSLCEIKCEHRKTPIGQFYINPQISQKDDLKEVKKVIGNNAFVFEDLMDGLGNNERTKGVEIKEKELPKELKEIEKTKEHKDKLKEENKELKNKIKELKKEKNEVVKELKKENKELKEENKEIEKELKEEESELKEENKGKVKPIKQPEIKKEKIIKEMDLKATKPKPKVSDTILIDFEMNEISKKTKQELKKQVNKIINKILEMKEVNAEIIVYSNKTVIADQKVKKVIDYFLTETPLLDDEIKIKEEKVKLDEEFKIEVKKIK